MVVPGAAEKVGVEEELAFEQVDLAGLLDRMHTLPDSVTFAFTDEKKPNPYDIPTLRANIPPEVRDPVRPAAGTSSSPLPVDSDVIRYPIRIVRITARSLLVYVCVD